MSFIFNNDENNWYHETYAPVENTNPKDIIDGPEPKPWPGPIIDGPEPQDPNYPWVMWDSQQNTSTNPLMTLLGIQQNNNGNIPVAQQKKVKKQYPALSSLFGTKLQSNSMALDGDDGGDGGGGDPNGGDDPPVLTGGIEYPGEPSDPEPYPVDYPEPDEPDDTNEGFKKVVLGTLGATLNAALQAAYYKGNRDGHSSDYKDSINQMNTSIAALNEAHQIQQKNMDDILQKVASTGSQAEYSKLLNTYAQQREQVQSTQNLATRIQYAAENHDYQNVANEVQNYTLPDQPATAPAPSLNDLNQNDWRYEQNPQLQAGLEKSFGSASNTPVQYYTPQNQNYNTVPVRNYAPYQQAPEHNFGTSDFPVFHLGVANGNPTTPIETTGTIQTNISSNADKVLSSGTKVNDFISSLGKDIGANNETLQKAIATYNSPTGQKIQVACHRQLQIGIEKIMQECNVALDMSKIAGTIAEKVSPYLAGIYILQKTYEGFINGGIKEASIEFFKTGIEVAVILAVAEGLGAAGMAAIPAFVLTLIVEYVLNLTGVFK